MQIKEIVGLIDKNIESGDVKQNLKDLLILYSHIYKKLGDLAVQYDKGTHPKHRLTRYHDFFVNNVEKDESVLDLGTGRGDVAYDVAKKTSKIVIGLDINSHNINYAKNTYRLINLVFVKGDIYKDIIDQNFDVVILSNVLEHLDNRVELLKTIISKAKPRKILIRVPQFERDWTVPMKKELGVPYFLDSTHKIEYTYDEFEKELFSAGLHISKVQINWGEIWAVCTNSGVRAPSEAR